MAFETDTQDTTVRRRNVDFISDNNNNEKIENVSDGEADTNSFDADSTTLDPIVAKELKHTTETLEHNDALNKLKEVGAKTPILASEIGTDFSFKRKIVWSNAIGFLILHILAVIGIVLPGLGYAKLLTVLYS